MSYGYPQDGDYGAYGNQPPPPGGGGYGNYGGYGPGPAPDNQLVPAILTTIFCCLPFGIVSIVFAAQVNSKWQMGDVQGAQQSADMARKWWIAALVSGLVVIVLYVILIVFAGAFSFMGATSGLD